MNIDRRQFLLRGAQSLAAFVLAPSLLPGCGDSARDYVATGTGQAPATLEALASSLDGPLLQPGAAEFAQAARPWNLRYADRLPAAIARSAPAPATAPAADPSWRAKGGVDLAIRRETAGGLDQAVTETDTLPAGTRLRLSVPAALAWAAVFSFNGNKIMTTSGGGMLASQDRALIDHAEKRR